MALLERVSVRPAREIASFSEIPAGTRYIPAQPLTVDQFFDLIEEDSPAELDEGAVVMPSPVNLQHEDGFVFLLGLLRLFVDAKGLGVVLGSRAKVRLGPRTAREPDICFLSTQRAHLLRQQEIAGALDLVVEIITSDKGRSEALAKRTQYEAAGVQELWLLDFLLRRLHFLLLKDGLYEETVLGDAETVSSHVVPGFRVTVAALLSPVGQYPPQWPIVEALLQASADTPDNTQ
jgi:Uma2 family endonuclease